MTLKRSFDATFINSVINDPRIYPWVAYRIPMGQLDIGPLLINARNVLLVNEGGGVFFQWIWPHCYEAHIQFLPGFRGRFAFDSAREAVAWMFTNTDAEKLLAVIPVTHRGSQKVARSVGFVRTGRVDPQSRPTPDGLVDGLEFSLSRRKYQDMNDGN